MIQMKMNSPESLATESKQAIQFLTTISELLKQQRRHFDDAVVTHCIRLINDYVEDLMRESSAEIKRGTGDKTHNAKSEAP